MLNSLNVTHTGYTHTAIVREYMEIHPNAPYMYGHWSSIPDDIEEHPRWCRYFSLYQPMVTKNSVAYIEFSECDEILSPMPERVVASMFVYEEIYLVVSNLLGTTLCLPCFRALIDTEILKELMSCG